MSTWKKIIVSGSNAQLASLQTGQLNVSGNTSLTGSVTISDTLEVTGNVTASAFVKSGATSNDILLGDGTTTTLGTIQQNAVISSDITVALADGKNIGKYLNGDTIPSTGWTLDQLITDLARETINPTFTNPSVNATLTSTGTFEVGKSYSATLTAVYDQGDILGDNDVNGVWDANAVQNPRAGAADTYVMNGGAPQGTNTLSISGYAVTQGTNTFSVQVNYLQGPQPLNNNDQNFSTPLSQGSVSDTVSIVGRYKTFYGPVATVPTTSAGIRALPYQAWDNVNTLNSETFSEVNYVIALPPGNTLTNVLTSNNEPITENFTATTLNVKDGSGTTDVLYNVYTFTSVEPLNVTATISTT
jgi:hypothetical protein